MEVERIFVESLRNLAKALCCLSKALETNGPPLTVPERFRF